MLRSRGVYFEAKLFQRDRKIFAKRGNGYVRLLPQFSTTVSKLSWSEIKGVAYHEHGGDVLALPPLLNAA